MIASLQLEVANGGLGGFGHYRFGFGLFQRDFWVLVHFATFTCNQHGFRELLGMVLIHLPQEFLCIALNFVI